MALQFHNEQELIGMLDRLATKEDYEETIIKTRSYAVGEALPSATEFGKGIALTDNGLKIANAGVWSDVGGGGGIPGDITNYGAVSGQDSTAALVSAIAENNYVYIPNGNYIIGNVNLKSNLTIIGSGAASKITFLSGASGYCLNGIGFTDILIKDLWLSGGNEIDYKASTTIGTRGGAILDGSKESCKIINCTISGFNGIGIGTVGDSTANHAGVLVTDNTITSNFCGISTSPSGTNLLGNVGNGNGSEYSKIVSNTVTFCRYGIVSSAGNTNIVGNSLHRNGYAIYIGASTNIGHGEISGNIVNHSLVNGLYCGGNSNGHSIVGNNFYYSDTYFTTSTGIVFAGNLISGNLTIDSIGVYLISNNIWMTNPVISGTNLTAIFKDNICTATGAALSIDLQPSLIKYYTASATELITNGDFSSGTGWTIGAGAAISSGQLVFTASSAITSQTALALSPSTIYIITLTVSNYSAGTFKVGIGGQETTLVSPVANGTYTIPIRFPATGGVGTFYFQSVGFTASIDNISIKQALSDKYYLSPPAISVGSKIIDCAAISATSTTQGFLPPRMTQAQADAIANKLEGLMVFISDATPKKVYTWIDGAWA